jgi:endonuclease YncB( thermonuclease family)
MIKFIIITFTFFFFQITQASEIEGFPKIVDGDTIYIKSYKIRLEGIDAPEMKQKCKKPFFQVMFFNFEKDYYCGQISKKNLLK